MRWEPGPPSGRRRAEIHSSGLKAFLAKCYHHGGKPLCGLQATFVGLCGGGGGGSSILGPGARTLCLPVFPLLLHLPYVPANKRNKQTKASVATSHFSPGHVGFNGASQSRAKHPKCLAGLVRVLGSEWGVVGG